MQFQNKWYIASFVKHHCDPEQSTFSIMQFSSFQVTKTWSVHIRCSTLMYIMDKLQISNRQLPKLTCS